MLQAPGSELSRPHPVFSFWLRVSLRLLPTRLWLRAPGSMLLAGAQAPATPALMNDTLVQGMMKGLTDKIAAIISDK